MRVLVACEFSGIVRNAFRRRGHDAISCDILPAEDNPPPGQHYEGDVRDLISYKHHWDILIAHPPCTYLANAGVRHLHSVPSKNGKLPEIHGERRWELMRKAAEFFKLLLNANADHICIENPVPHRYAVKVIGRKYDQLIQPWQFGHGETKKTCLWLKNLPLLMPTNVVDGREARIHKMPPGPNRGKERSRTYPGIAEAFATQWG